MKLKTLLNIIGTAALLWYVAYSANLLNPEGRRELLRVLGGVSPLIVAASLLAGLFTNLASTLKWRWLLNARRVEVGFWTLFAYYMASKPFNLLLPSGAGGDAMRVHAVGRRSGNYSDPAAAVVLDRLTGLAMVVGLAAIAVLCNLELFGKGWLLLGMALGALGIAVVAWLIFDERPLGMLCGRFGREGSWPARLLGATQRCQAAARSYREDKTALALGLVGSVVVNLSIIINIWLGVLAFAPGTSFWRVLAVAPVTLLLVNVPVALGGAGPAEFAYGFPLGLIGISPAISLSAALLLRARTLLDDLIGGLIYLGVGVRGASPKKEAAQVVGDRQQATGNSKPNYHL